MSQQANTDWVEDNILSTAQCSSDDIIYDRFPYTVKKESYDFPAKIKVIKVISRVLCCTNFAAVCAAVSYSDPNEEMRKGSKRPKATRPGG